MHTSRPIKNIYPIIFFGLSLLACVASVGGYFFTAAEREGSAITLPNDAPMHHPYQPTLSDGAQAAETVWEAPLPQDPGGSWKFGIFTPPQIWFNRKTRTWAAEPPNPTPPLKFRLLDIRRDPFRLHFKGYSATTAAAKILIENTETRQSVRGSVGTEFPEQEFVILSFKETLNPNEDGTKIRSAATVILDQRTGKEVTLIKGKQQYTDNFIIMLQEIKNPARQFTLKTNGASFRIEETTYTLKSVDIESKRVTLERKSLQDKTTTVRTLEIGGGPEMQWPF